VDDAAFGPPCARARIACAQVKDVKADSGSVAIGGNVSSSTINIGIPPEVLASLVRQSADLSDAQKKNISDLERKLDLNQRQIRAALDILGEANVATEQLGAKLVEIAERFRALQATASALPGDTPKVIALKAEAQKAIDVGELARADTLLAEVDAEQSQALDRLALNAAETSARRGDIALARLRYGEAAAHFANAAAKLPPQSAHEDIRRGYLLREVDAFYRQGEEFGDKLPLSVLLSSDVSV
jgi:outer membrane PBP1 activator LpoA protein